MRKRPKNDKEAEATLQPGGGSDLGTVSVTSCWRLESR